MINKVSTDDAAAQVARRSNMDIAVRGDRAAKRVWRFRPQVQRGRRNDGQPCRGRCRVALLRGTAVETSHRGDAWPARPYVLKAAQKSLRCRNTTCDFNAGFAVSRAPANRKCLPHWRQQRVLGRGILRLLKATVRTLHTELRRRLGHNPGAMLGNDPQTRAWPRRASPLRDISAGTAI